jgi:hypothetical protein
MGLEVTLGFWGQFLSWTQKPVFNHATFIQVVAVIQNQGSPLFLMMSIWLLSLI